MDFELARANMVDQQIRPWEVLDQHVLDAVANVPREAFVPPEYRLLALADTAIPIGHGQKMMTPKLEARLLQALAIQPDDRVLEIGTGSGYLTALLARLGGSVVSFEIIPELSSTAAQTLACARTQDISLQNADGLSALTDTTPFDIIAVTGACASRRPELEAQLALNGRMFIICGVAPAMEALLITRAATDAYTCASIFETELDYLHGADPTPTFSF